LVFVHIPVGQRSSRLQSQKARTAILVRERVHLVESFTYRFRQPYHTAKNMPQKEAPQFISKLQAEAGELAFKAIQQTQAQLQAQGYEFKRCGLLLASGRALPDLAHILASLGNVEEGTSYGTAAFKVGGALFVRLHQDFDSTIVVRTDFEQREELLAADPETYFITDHYRNYQWVLVRLSQIRPDILPDLLRTAWRLAARSERRRRVSD
jgi:hypothetical protein